MGNKSVDRAEMAKAAQQIDTKHQQIQTLQSRLRGEMQQLRAVWTGKASMAFQQGYQRFDEEYEKVKKLRQMLFAMKPSDAMEKLVKKLAEFETNDEFLVDI